MYIGNITKITGSHILFEADVWLGPKRSSKISLRRFSKPSKKILKVWKWCDFLC